MFWEATVGVYTARFEDKIWIVSELWQMLLLLTHLFQSVLLASVKQHREKCWILKPSLRQKKTHGAASAGVKNIRNLSVWVKLRKSIFNCSARAFQRIINYSRRCTQEMWGCACLLSSFPHDLSNICHFNSSNSTVINVLISIFPPLCLCCLSYRLIIN